MSSTKCHLHVTLPGNLLTHPKELRIYTIATFQQITVVEVNVAGLPLSDPPILPLLGTSLKLTLNLKSQFSKFTISSKWRPSIRSI